jgi:hypothetical protein
MLPTSNYASLPAALSLTTKQVLKHRHSVKTIHSNQHLKSTESPQRAKPWTNFSYQDKTWAEFSTLDMAMCIQHVLHT